LTPILEAANLIGMKKKIKKQVKKKPAPKRARAKDESQSALSVVERAIGGKLATNRRN